MYKSQHYFPKDNDKNNRFETFLCGDIELIFLGITISASLGLIISKWSVVMYFTVQFLRVMALLRSNFTY